MNEPKRGRPPLFGDETPARLHVTVQSKDYDRAQERAKQEGISVPDLLRRGLARVLEEETQE